MQAPRVHWADQTAERIIKQIGDKETYVFASGITPSGVVHFGNFREVITVDLVARAMREKGKKVRFIFSWDDFDTFRKIPANMPNQEELKKFLFHPIVDTPDPFGEHNSYAEHHEKSFESQLEKVGVSVEPLYQAKKYRAGEYRDSIIHALKNRKTIRDILNQHRTEPYGDEYFPVSIYCEKNLTDKVTILSYDGEYTLSYRHESGYEGTVDLRNSQNVKLPWRVDWPMRWAYEQVDFEPGGKDHSSEGGSYTTAKEIVKVFNFRPPVYLQYDFVSIRGMGGKMSSSKGNLVTVNDVLEVYEPEIVRWIFASYRPNVDFAVSFDLDVLKTYEDFDRMERLAYGLEPGNEKKVGMAQRAYELSQIEGVPDSCPFQPSFRHLCNILQIHDGNIEKAKSYYEEFLKTPRDKRRFLERSTCALKWLEAHAPDEFKFKVNAKAPGMDLTKEQRGFIEKFSDLLDTSFDTYADDKAIHESMYKLIHQVELDPSEVFQILYQLLISQPKGPKLAGFIRTLGKERVIGLLRSL